MKTCLVIIASFVVVFFLITGACIVVLHTASSGNYGPPQQRVLYVQPPVLNLRTEPNTNSPIIRKLKKSERLTLLKEMPEWSKVKYADQVGWVKNDYVQTMPDSYERFMIPFDLMNYRTEKETGIRLFLDASFEGDGILNVTATPFWLSASAEDRKNNLIIIFNLWDAAEASGLPIHVNIIDTNGNICMVMGRDGRGVVSIKD